MKRIIYAAPSFLAVAEDGVLTEYIPSTADHQSGDILLGTVRRLMPGISAACVDIGREKCGFLPMRESSLSFSSDSLRSGDCIAVQIRKEEIRPAAFSSDDAETYSADSPQKAAKGAFLTRDLSIPGKFILLMPLNRYIGVSSSIRDEEERERLRSLGAHITRSP